MQDLRECFLAIGGNFEELIGSSMRDGSAAFEIQFGIGWCQQPRQQIRPGGLVGDKQDTHH